MGVHYWITKPKIDARGQCNFGIVIITDQIDRKTWGQMIPTRWLFVWIIDREPIFQVGG